MKHQTYRQLLPGNIARICCHQCAWEIEYDYDPEAGAIIQRPESGGYTRISHEGEIQEAIDAGIVGRELVPIVEKYAAPHHWCLNNDCDGTGDGSCGIALNVEAVT